MAESHFRVSAGIWEILSDQPRLVDAWNALLIVKLNTNDLAEAQVLGKNALDMARRRRRLQHGHRALQPRARRPHRKPAG